MHRSHNGRRNNHGDKGNTDQEINHEELPLSQFERALLSAASGTQYVARYLIGSLGRNG
jgi:hypothetical protein